jgi:hypothetical protein
LFWAGIASADTLYLRDGRSLDGTYQGGARGEVRFQTGGRTQIYRLSEIQSLTFSDNGSYNNNNSGRRDRYRSSSDRYNNYGNSPSSGTSSASMLIPEGTVVTVRTIDAIDSDRSAAGQTFRASLDEPIVVNGRTLAPAGADVMLRVVNVQQGGGIRGHEEISVALDSVMIDGRMTPVNSGEAQVASKDRGRQSATVIGGTAVVGAILGAIAGGGKGAAIGAASGAGAGAAVQAIRGQRVKIPAESRLDFRVQQQPAYGQ